MPNLEKLRLPYRDDTAFSLLAVGLFLVPVAFSLYSYENFESIKFALFLIFTGASVLAYFLGRRRVATTLPLSKYFYGSLLAFFVWACISAALAQDKLYSFFGFYYRYTSGVVFYGVLLLFIFQLVNCLDREKFLYLLKILIIDALAVAVITYLQSFGWIFYAGLDSSGIFRGPSLLGNPNYSAMFLACALPLAVYFFSQARKLPGQIYYAVSSVLIVLACLMLASRGALLGVAVAAAVALFFLAVLKFPKKLFWTLLGLTLAGGILGLLFLNVSRPGAISGLGGVEDVNTVSRFFAWRISLQGILQHPWFGSGPGNYALFFEHVHNLLPFQAGGFGVFDDAHNLFLQLAVTGGLPLLLFFLAAVFLPVFAGLKNLFKTKDLLVLCLLASLAAWLTAVTFNPVPIPMYLFLAVILVGLMLANIKGAQIKVSPVGKFLFIFLGAIVLVWGLGNFAAENLLGYTRDTYAGQNYLYVYKFARVANWLNPSNGLALNYEAASAIYMGKPENEIGGLIARIKKLHPTQAETYVNSSHLYSMLYDKNHHPVDLQAAIFDMQSAINLDALSPGRHGQLALYYYQLGDINNAESSIKQELALNKGDFSSWILLAKLYQLQNRKQDVVMALTQAFNINPDIPQLKYLLDSAKNSTDIQKVPIEIMARPPEI